MNFFEAQDQARKNTTRLVFLFAMAVIALVLLSNLLIFSVYAKIMTGSLVFDPRVLVALYSWREFASVSGAICLLIVAGSIFKTWSLSGSGALIAERLGGRQVPAATGDPRERQLLNVVEEMAIAAGMPIPQVYLLAEPGINAFAAGMTVHNAVIGVTRGAIERLNREQLQGVIAHEFSHITHGDMRINLRLIGILHGILLIGLIGSQLLRSYRFAGYSRKRNDGSGIVAMMILGLGLLVVGYAGSFFGRWIKSAVSRQREYLADASAVQFTRNKNGIADALKKIGGPHTGSYLESNFASQYNHAFFAEAISSFWMGMFTTHPPVADRIKKIDPAWDGEFLTSEVIRNDLSEQSAADPASVNSMGIPMAAVAAVLSSAEQAIAQIGSLNEENIDYVHQLILGMPTLLRDACHEAYSVRAVIYAVSIGLQKDEDAASSFLQNLIEPELFERTQRYLVEVKNLQDQFRFPLLELAVSSLRELSPNQFTQFKTVLNQLLASDKSINLQEWVMKRFLIQQLDDHFGFRSPLKSKYSNLKPLRAEVATILSLIAYVEHQDESSASRAFQSGAKVVALGDLQIIPKTQLKLGMLDHALDRLTQLMPLAKPRLLRACVAVILDDQVPMIKGIELVRTISSCLDCPMPPLRPASDR